MDLPNPSINPPRLQSSSNRWSVHSRSPSRSPVRLQHFDPLLRDLSPTATLRAFSVQPGQEVTHPLSRSVEDATSAQRSLGITAAQTCLDVRSWTRELELWPWPETFEAPATESSKQGGDGRETKLGSLAAETVEAYERRLDEVREDLEGVDVEGLKEFVLSAHNQASSAPADVDDSIIAIGAATDLKRLDDFTALITATILQSLPFLSRLHRLLDTWTIRVAILTEVPQFLRKLDLAREELEQCWKSLRPGIAEKRTGQPLFDRKVMNDIKASISAQISRLGRRLDIFLDTLEGRPETVPDSWIDKFESLEGEYSNWVVQAERKLLEDEFETASHQRSGSRTLLHPADEPIKVPDGSVIDEKEVMPSAGPDQQVILEQRDTNGVRDGAVMVPAIGDALPATASVFTFMEMPEDSAAAASMPLSAYPFKLRGLQGGLSMPENQSSRPTSRLSFASDQTSPLGKTNLQASGIADIEVPGTEEQNSTLIEAPEAGQKSTIKTRAAFFNQNLEKAGTLNKSKSPPVVRPFEHASNAFTRLFRKALPDQVSRNSSSASKRSMNSAKSMDANKVPLGTASDLHVSSESSEQTKPRTQSESLPRDDDFDLLPPMAELPSSPIASVRYKAGTPDAPSLKDQDRTSWSSRPTSPWGESVPRTYIPTGMLSSPFHSPHKAEFEAEPGFEPGPESGTEPAPFDEAPADEHPPNWPLSNEPLTASSLAATGLGLVNMQQGATQELDRTPFGAVVTSDIQLAQPLTLSSAENGQNAASPDFHVSSFGRSSPSSTRLPGKRIYSRPISTVVEEADLPVEASISRADGKEAEDTESSPLAAKERRGRSRAAVTGNAAAPHVRSPSAPGDGVVQMITTGSIIRRANSKSIESFPISQLKRVDVVAPLARRHSASYDSYRSSPAPSSHGSSRSTSPASQTPGGKNVASESPTLSYNGQLFPSPPKQTSNVPSSPATPDESPTLPRRWIATDLSSNNPRSSLNAVVSRTRSKIPVSSAVDASSCSPVTAPSMDAGDNFDRHVSAVLDRVHAPIRFRTRPGAETPVGSRPNEPKNFSGLRPKSRLTQRGQQSITLAPAEPSPKRQRSSADDVKVYFLQTGRDEPIKLFVRLVGEDQRVMVRVGGGWADLADYLRQYAEHHGSRTVSEGGLEVSAATTQSPSNVSSAGGSNSAHNAGTRRTFSMPANSTQSAQAAGPEPSSSTGAVRTSGTRDEAVDREWLQQPQPEFSMGDDDEVYELPASPVPQPTQQQTSRLPIASPATASNSETAASSTSTSAGATNNASSSLAGPSSARKAGLAEQKARWVEDMLGRAKASAAEGRDENAKDAKTAFTELGRVGGTRRVIMRSVSSGHNGDGRSESPGA